MRACAPPESRVVGPKAHNLAGTKVGDMKIAFVTDPDGVLSELIERPAKLFRRR